MDYSNITEDIKDSYKNKDRNIIIILVLLLLITNICVYYKFIFGKYAFVYKDWGYDTYHSYIPAMEFWAQKIRDGNFSPMSFQFGLGTDINSLSIWLGNPFILCLIIISTFIGPEKIGILIVYVPIIESIVAAIIMYFYLKNFHFSYKSMLLTSYIYGFCGYIFSTGQHYWFVIYLICFPLLLIGIENAINQNKFILLTIATFFIGCQGGYGAFAMFIAGGSYFLYKISLQGLQTGIKKTLKKIVVSIMYVILGLFMSSFLFLPYMYEILEVSGRVSEESILEKAISSLKIISPEYLKTAFLRIFSNNLEGTVNNWMGVDQHFSAYPYYFSLLFPLLLPQYCFNNKKYKNKKEAAIKIFAGIILVLSFLLYFVPMLFNLFSYAQYRAIYIFLPCFAFIMAKTLDNIMYCQCFNRYVNISFVILYSLSLYAIVFQNDGIGDKKIVREVIISLVVIAILLDILYHRSKKNIYYSLLFISISGSMLIDNEISLYKDRVPAAKIEILSSYHAKDLWDIINYVDLKEKDNFFRIERTYLGDTADANWSLLIPCRTLSTYHSLLNENIKTYLKKMIVYQDYNFDGIQFIYPIYNFGTILDTTEASILGLKYIISDKPRNSIDWEFEKEVQGKYLYKNKQINTIGLLYENYIIEEEYEKLSLLEKSFIKTQAVVVNEKLEEMDSIEDVMIEDNSEAIELKKVSGSEGVQVEIAEGNIKGFAKDKATIKIPLNNSLINQKKQHNELRMNILSSIPCKIEISFGLNNEIINLDQWNNGSYLKNGEEKEIVLSLPSDAKDIQITFENATDFIIKEIELKKIKVQYKNEGIQFENPKMGGIVEGTVDAKNRSILYMPIPYQKGWHVYINGEEGEILKANYGFQAIVLPKGINNIQFIYKSPVLTIAYTLSVISGIIFLILILKNKKMTI